MRSVFRSLVLVAVALLVPVLPLFVLGFSFEEQLEAVLQQEFSAVVRCALIVGLLATDLFLPVPSSMVSTYGGGVLGTWAATGASWVGMTLGALAGFGLARALGRPFALRFAGAEDLARMEDLSRRFGPLALLVTRALPILAEACVLLMGATRLSWRRFLIPVVIGNFVVSLTYAACGEYFQGIDALPIAVVGSGAVPLIAALALRRWWPMG